MKKYFILGLIFTLISCKKHEVRDSKRVVLNDSITSYLKISNNTALSPSTRLIATNKIIYLLEDKKFDSIYSKSQHQKSILHFSLNQFDSLIYSNVRMRDYAIKIHDYKSLGKGYYLMGYYLNEVANSPDSAFSNYNMSKYYYQQIKDSSWIGKNLLNMGAIQKDQNDFFGSKETLIEALYYLNQDKDQSSIAGVYNILATNHRKLQNFSDAIKYYLKAIQLTNSDKNKLIYQNNLATTYIDNQKYNDAILLLKSISQDSLLITNQKEYARVLDNLTYAKWLSDIAIKEVDFQEPLKIRVQSKDQRGQIASYTHLGQYYSQGNKKRAKSYYDSVIRLSKILKIPRAEKDVLKFLMNLEPQNVGIRNRYVLLQDSLYEQEKKVKTQFAKYKYDDKLKQESILRLEKEKAQQELEVVQQRSLKISSYYLGGVLLLISGFVTYFFMQRSKRLKQQNKTAKLEATYETEAALSRKLHDDFGGKLNHAMVLLQNGADSIEVLNVVDGLYNQSRDFSREINDVDTGPNFKDFLFRMMGNYSKNTKLIVSGSTDVDWLKVSPLSKKTLFKVLQELMINMQKHSNANLVSFGFEQTKKILRVIYTDDGAGASSEELNLKNGLWNTEKRIETIGGTIIFDSKKGQGFEARIEIPN